MHSVLGILKKFDPVGIFSQSLEECLGTQLNEMGYLDEAMVALLDNLDLLARGDVKKISKICFVDEKKIKEMVTFIRKCNPHPIDTYDNDFENKIPPDIIAKKEGRKWIVSLNEETFEKNLLEYPQYTKPQKWEKKDVPDVLLTGDHAKIKDWRLSQSEDITRRRRADLWEKYKKNK